MKKDEARTMSLPRNIGGEYRRNGYVVPCNLPNATKSTIQVNYNIIMLIYKKIYLMIFATISTMNDVIVCFIIYSNNIYNFRGI